MSYKEKCDKIMIKNVSFFGQIIDHYQAGRYIYIICNDRGIFSLIKHEKGFDITNIVIRCSSLEMVEELLKNELKQ